MDHAKIVLNDMDQAVSDLVKQGGDAFDVYHLRIMGGVPREEAGEAFKMGTGHYPWDSRVG
jgi:hypothetical protein